MQIVILGSGNIASNLLYALNETSVKVRCLYGRNAVKTEKLANRYSIPYTNIITEIPKNAHLYIIAVSDNAIVQVAKSLPDINGMLVHTAGSVAMHNLHPYAHNYGVCYFLQSFSEEAPTMFQNIPAFIETNLPENLQLLKQFVNTLTPHCFEYNSVQRLQLHLASVIACNFTNHFLAIAYKLLNSDIQTYGHLKPLMEHTLNKAFNNNPLLVQTGPAVRNDTQTLEKHLNILENDPEIKNLYKFVSDNIVKLSQTKKNPDEF